ncbi:MFS transporter [Brachybacterium hainanense]|uniref:MFS transporter n=1 Tax=Brachybacterium hainanense TaxID=1541174 RepID=A0ABV6RGA2_9MICO
MDATRTPAAVPAAPADIPLRRNREYRIWLLGDVLLSAGSGIGAFAFPLVTLAVTGSAAATGLVGLVQGIGGLLGLIPGGLLCDRVDRRRLRMLDGMLGALLQGILVLILLAGAGSVGILAALAVADRFRGALLGRSSDAMLKQIVTPRQIPRAVAVNEGRDAAVELGAGPLGGALLAVSLALPALAQLIGALAAGLTTLLLRGDYRPRAQDAPPTRVREDLREAGAWVLAQPIRLQLGAVAALINLGSNGLILTVTLSLALQHVPAVQIGLLSSVLGGSVLAGALLAPRIVEHIPTGLLILGQIMLMAVLGLVLALTDQVIVIAVVYAAIGLGIAPLNAASSGFFMLITPVAMQGRIGALMSLVATALMPLAPAVAGWGLDGLGRLGTMLIFAGICVLAVLITLCGSHLRAVPAARGWEEHARRRGLQAD